jgi:hypothetical protein
MDELAKKIRMLPLAESEGVTAEFLSAPLTPLRHTQLINRLEQAMNQLRNYQKNLQITVRELQSRLTRAFNNLKKYTLH